jgi:hypothetical protein
MKDELTDDLFEEYQRKNFSAGDIFNFIDSQRVTRELGVKLIEGYGLRKTGEAIEKMRKESGIEYGKEVDEIILRMNKKLDKVLDGVRSEIIQTKQARRRK